MAHRYVYFVNENFPEVAGRAIQVQLVGDFARDLLDFKLSRPRPVSDLFIHHFDRRFNSGTELLAEFGRWSYPQRGDYFLAERLPLIAIQLFAERLRLLVIQLADLDTYRSEEHTSE